MENEELIVIIREKWEELYKNYNSLPPGEYARRRKIYEKMIWELQGLIH